MKILKITSTSKSQEPSRSLMSRKVTALSTENDTKTDVFVQKSAVVKNNPKKSIKSLGEGEIVEFDVFAGKNDSIVKQRTFPDLKEYLSSEHLSRLIVGVAIIFVVANS